VAGLRPLDLLWLLADPAQRQHEAVEAFLDSLEVNFDRLGVLQGLPTLGPRIVPDLVGRLQRHAVAKRGLQYRYRDLLFETEWFGELYAVVPSPLQRYALRQLEKSRKDLLETLQKRKREK